MRHLFVLFLVFETTLVFPQNYIKRCNFGFETNRIVVPDNWQLILDSYQLKYDTIDKVQGKRSIAFSRTYLKSDFNLCLYQKILLPKSFSEISVSVFSKTINHQYSWLKIAGFDRYGKIIVTDSLSIISNNSWHEFTARIAHKGIYLLSLELRAKEQFNTKKKEVKLWLDSITVICDGRNLLSLNDPLIAFSAKDLAAINNNIPLDEDMILPGNVLKKMAKNRIIGFGETAHGSLETNKCIYNNIRQLISDYNCRLVLLEMPIDLVAQYNLYIHGFEIDSTYCKFYPNQSKIDTTYRKLSYLSNELERFVNWLKEFNAIHDDKVNIMGIDEHSDPLSSNMAPPDLNRYISSMKLQSNIVDTLVFLINSGNYRIVPYRYAERNEKQLTTLMSRFNYMVLLQALKSRTDSALYYPSYKSYEWQHVHRDHIMWQNAKQVLENFSDGKLPVVICAHYGHLDKISSIHFNEVVTLGQYLSNAYGNNYYHVGILLGQGKAGAMGGKRKLVYQELQIPVGVSIEYLASRTNQECFYKSGNISSKIPMMIRRSGNESTNDQFIPSYFPGSMDGFIYIRKSSPSFKL